MATPSRKRPRILHVQPTFEPGGRELRSVQLINAFGPGLDHAIVGPGPEERGAAMRLDRRVRVTFPERFPQLRGKPFPGRLQRIARALKPYDLVLTYNWGAMDVAMAHTLFGQALGLPPLIHHEDGFNEDEQERLKWTRNWYRRIALGRSSGLVVPSETLEGIALEAWQQPIGRVKMIPNGVDTAAFAKRPRANAMRGIVKHEGEKWVGTLAGLRPVKNLPLLVRAFAGLPEEWQLVLLGEGPERDRIRAEAERLEIGHRVHMPGFARDPAKVVGLFDIFALSSDSEQFPVSVVQAMAAGLAVAAPAVGDVYTMLDEANHHFVVPRRDELALSRALSRLAQDAELRARIGEANRAKARAHFDESRMIDAYRRLYASAMGLPTLP